MQRVKGPAVEATGLELRYGDKLALAPSSFALPAPGVSVLIGPNGSGKSTLLAAIAGLHRPAAGTIEVLGNAAEKARARVAFVPQSTKVNDALPVTVREVVGMGRYASLGIRRRFRDADREAVAWAMERLDINGVSSEHLRELSGGQRQRVFVAQGLVQERDLLLLDEPTVALDLVSARVIAAVIDDEQSQGRPVVVTTHDLAEARRADHVLLLASEVIAQGPPDSVLTPENLARAYGYDMGEMTAHPHIDDAAHRPTASRHIHADTRQGRAPGDRT